MDTNFTTYWQNKTSIIRIVIRSSLAKNAISLYAIQFANYILPLITVPYLVRVLGPTGFGMVAFGQSLIAYFAIFVDYGFALSATRKISVERENIEAVSQIAFNVWAAKALLCLAGLLALLLLISIVAKFHEASALLMVLYGSVIGNVLFPTWLFQGMEKMVFISVINLIMRILVIAGIFTLVRHPADYLIYAGLMSLGSIGAGLAGAAIAFYKFKLSIVISSFRGIWETLVEGWPLFLCMASVSLYTTGNAFILGILTNPTVVGYYSAAEKIVKAILGLLNPISQAAYPKISRIASKSKALALQWGRRMLILMGGIGFILSITIFITAPLIVRIVLGPEYSPSIMVMRILASLIFIIGSATVWSTLLLIPFGYDRVVVLILFTAGLINIVMALILVPFYYQIGMAISVLLAEVFVNAATFVYSWRCGLCPLRGVKSSIDYAYR